jgi:hypothetical protein
MNLLMARSAHHNALGEFSEAPISRPRPDAMREFGRWVFVMNLKTFCRSTPNANPAAHPLGPTVTHPTTEILALYDFVAIRHFLGVCSGGFDDAGESFIGGDEP